MSPRQKREAGNPKTVVAVIVLRIEPIANPRAAVPSVVAPRTTPKQARTIVIRIYINFTPRDAAVVFEALWFEFIILMPFISTPLPDVAVHVIETPSIGQMFAYWMRNIFLYQAYFFNWLSSSPKQYSV